MSAEPTKVVEVFHGEPRPFKARNGLCERMERSAGVMAQNMADDLAGYIVIGVAKDGAWSLGFGVDPDATIGARMLAGLGIVAIQEDMVTQYAIKQALIRNGLVKPDPPKGA